jgi:hypothetical protein
LERGQQNSEKLQQNKRERYGLIRRRAIVFVNSPTFRRDSLKLFQAKYQKKKKKQKALV